MDFIAYIKNITLLKPSNILHITSVGVRFYLNKFLLANLKYYILLLKVN